MKFLILLALVAAASARYTSGIGSILNNVEAINELEQEQQMYGSGSPFVTVGGVQDASLAEKMIMAEQVAQGSSFGRSPVEAILEGVNTVSPIQQQQILEDIREQEQIATLRQGGFSSFNPLTKRMILASQTSTFNPTTVVTDIRGRPLTASAILANQLTTGYLNPMTVVTDVRGRPFTTGSAYLANQYTTGSFNPIARRFSRNPFLASQLDASTSAFSPLAQVYQSSPFSPRNSFLASQLGASAAFSPLAQEYQSSPFSSRNSYLASQFGASAAFSPLAQAYQASALSGSPMVAETILAGLNDPILADILASQDITTLKKEFIIAFYKNVVETLDILKTRFGNVIASADTVDELKGAIMPLKCQKLNGVMNWIMTTNIDITKYNANIFDTYMMCKMVDYATMMKSFAFKFNVKTGVMYRDLQLIRDVYDILGDRSVGLNRYETLMNSFIPTISQISPIEGFMTGRVVRV